MDLLETSALHCTKKGIVIRYTKNFSDISLYEAKNNYIGNEFQNIFEKGKLIAKGENKVKKEINNLNKEESKFNFYILETPIQAFEDMGLTQELKEKIEFIDLPGLESNQSFEENIKELLKKQSAFIFLKKGVVFDKKSASRTIELIYKETIKKDIFNINNCLFVFTFPNKEHYNMEDVSTSLIQIFEKQIIDKCMLKKKKNEDYINKNKLLISRIDTISYKSYLNLEKKIDNFSYFIDEITKQNYYDLYEYINSNYNYEKKYSSLKIKNRTKEKEYLKQLRNFGIKSNLNKIVESYLKIKENKKLLDDYQESYYEETINNLNKVIKNIEITLKEALNMKIHNFSRYVYPNISLIIILLNSNITLNKELKLEFNKETEELKLNLKEYYNELIDEIEDEYQRFGDRLKSINISFFIIDKEEKDFIESFEKNKKKMEEILDDTNHNIDIYLNHFEGKNKRDINKFKDNFKIIFQKLFGDYKNLDTIDIYESISKHNLENKEYKTFDYSDTKEYEDSYWFTKPFKRVWNNAMHDYIKDRKDITIKLIKINNQNFEITKNETKKNIKEAFIKTNNELNSYKEFINADWDLSISNKNKFLQYSEKLKENIEKFYELI